MGVAGSEAHACMGTWILVLLVVWVALGELDGCYEVVLGASC